MVNKVVMCSSLIASLFVTSNIEAKVFSERPEVKEFINEVAHQNKIDPNQALDALSKLESSEEIIKRITTPYEALSWDKYKKLLVGKKRINEGVKFWHDNSKVLQQAEDKYGVPASIIVAIIGVESSYGQNRGKYPVLQALATLAFDYPPRAKFFKNELKEYLLLTTEQHIDPLALNGSYAGAMGSPQFIASSYRNYAVDFDNSGQIDLVNNMNHAIGSVANYFKVHGWETNKPVAYKVKTSGNRYKELPVAAKNDPRPVLSLQTIQQHGVTTKEKVKDQEVNCAFLEFENGANKEYWLGFKNFYVITRYNHSNNYAMAVYQLSQAITNLQRKTDLTANNG